MSPWTVLLAATLFYAALIATLAALDLSPAAWMVLGSYIYVAGLCIWQGCWLKPESVETISSNWKGIRGVRARAASNPVHLPELDLGADGRAVIHSQGRDPQQQITVIGRGLLGDQPTFEVGAMGARALVSVWFEDRAELERLGTLLIAMARAGGGEVAPESVRIPPGAVPGTGENELPT